GGAGGLRLEGDEAEGLGPAGQQQCSGAAHRLGELIAVQGADDLDTVLDAELPGEILERGEVVREVLRDTAGEDESSLERGVEMSEDLEGEVGALERLEPGGEQQGGAMAAGDDVLAGVEAVHVHAGADHAEPGAGH